MKIVIYQSYYSMLTTLIETSSAIMGWLW